MASGNHIIAPIIPGVLRRFIAHPILSKHLYKFPFSASDVFFIVKVPWTDLVEAEKSQLQTLWGDLDCSLPIPSTSNSLDYGVPNLFRFLKSIARESVTTIAYYSWHERGDELVDEHAWVFNYQSNLLSEKDLVFTVEYLDGGVPINQHVFHGVAPTNTSPFSGWVFNHVKTHLGLAVKINLTDFADNSQAIDWERYRMDSRNPEYL